MSLLPFIYWFSIFEKGKSYFIGFPFLKNANHSFYSQHKRLQEEISGSKIKHKIF